jgi:arsenate reductase
MDVTPLNYKKVPPTRVLFLCIGNSCRSQMAAGFARAYGSDVLTVQSAGLAPAMTVSSLTHQVMLERDIDIGNEFPKSFETVLESDTELIINMSGHPLPAKTEARVETWAVRDPIGESEEVYREVRDQIEQRVMRLILKVRGSKPPVVAESPRVDTRRRTPRQ